MVMSVGSPRMRPPVGGGDLGHEIGWGPRERHRHRDGNDSGLNVTGGRFCGQGQPAAPTSTAPEAPLIDAPKPYSSAAVTFEAVPSSPAAAPPAPAEPASVDMPYVVPYTPFASTPSSVSRALSAPDSAHTVSAWMIAVLPALLAGSLLAASLLAASLLAAATELGDFYTAS
jgi:hypothetical protein